MLGGGDQQTPQPTLGTHNQFSASHVIFLPQFIRVGCPIPKIGCKSLKKASKPFLVKYPMGPHPIRSHLQEAL
jgi:hypothetical protein